MWYNLPSIREIGVMKLQGWGKTQLQLHHRALECSAGRWPWAPWVGCPGALPPWQEQAGSPGARQELTRANWPTCLTEYSRKGKAGPGVLSIHSGRGGRQQPLAADSDGSVEGGLTEIG